MKTKNTVRTNTINRAGKVLGMVLFLLAVMGIATAGASCIDLDDVPLDTMEQAAPGIVMFVIDDSGSMDWEFICQGSDDGKFRGGFEYLFDDPGDNVYSIYDGNGTILETYNGGQYANYYYSQWAGHNRLYFDPDEYYAPWPTFEDADPDNPRSNPDVAGNTLNLGATYYDFGDTGGVDTQTIINAGGVIVDNEDFVGSATYLIIDDEDSGYSLRDKYGPIGGYNLSNSGCYGNDYDRVYDSWEYLPFTATYNFSIPETGSYKVYARWHEYNNRSNEVQIRVNGNTEAIVDQEQSPRYIAGGGHYLADKYWYYVGEFEFNAGPGGAIIQYYHDGDNDSFSSDAVLLEFQDQDQSAGYQEFGDWYESAASGEYNGSSRYTSDAGDYATWTPSLPSTGTYEVYIWYTESGVRDTNAKYTVYHSGGESTFRINQQDDNSSWVRLGEFEFDSGTSGYIKVERDGSSTGSSTSADAVAFVEPLSGIEALNLIRAHYYVKVDGIFYLVNLDGKFTYYRVDDDNGNSVVDNLAELTNLSDAEAMDADIVPDGTYAEVRQNFANWYSFYRKRELTAKNAIANVINDMQGVYIGLHYINSGLASIARPVKVTLNDVLYDESSALLEDLYDDDASGNTYLRNGLKFVGKYFQGVDQDDHLPSATPSGSFSADSYPYFKPDLGGSCQQSFAIVMTDGYYNGSSPGVGNADKDDTGNSFDGGVYADTVSDTLADVAMYYYKNDLNSYLNDDVPINNVDQADHQHLVTYTLAFGVEGTIVQEDYPDCIKGGTCPSWPNPNDGDDEKIDDMYHAAVNGRGKYVDAASPQEMVNAMNALKQDIESRLGSSAALATNSIQRTVGTRVYQGTYNTAGWTGEIAALEVDQEDGSVDNTNPIWTANDNLPAWDEGRNIISFDGSASIDFFYSELSDSQKTLLANNAGGLTGTELTQYLQDLVNFIRGDTSNDLTKGGPFRTRTKLIGDVVHSTPLYYKGYVYIGANDGMLHAIKASNGVEIFAYIPNMVYGHLSDLSLPGYSHRYYVDSSPVAASIDGQDILVCGLGKGGKGYFGLDITNPASPVALWEYTGDDDLGYSFSDANIIKTKGSGAGYAVLAGNGYDSVSETAALLLINPVTGSLIKKLDAGAGDTGCNGLATPSAVDVNTDGYTDFVYAGDLHGNMWKFDLRSEDTGEWKIYYNDGSSPQPLIKVVNADGYAQPITAAPEVMYDCADSDFAEEGDGVLVIFGTGRYLNSDDFDNIDTESFYGIWDWGDIWEQKTDYETAKGKFLGALQTNRTLPLVSTSPSVGLQEQTEESSEDTWVVLSDNPVEWYDPDNAEGAHMGWVFDLTTPGERGVRNPRLNFGAVEMISMTPSDSPCEAGGSSVLYRMNACTGGYTSDPQFDVDGDGDIDDDDRLSNEKAPTGKEFEQMLFEGIRIGDRQYYSDTEGNINSLKNPPVDLGVFYWRVIQ